VRWIQRPHFSDREAGFLVFRPDEPRLNEFQIQQGTDNGIYCLLHRHDDHDYFYQINLMVNTETYNFRGVPQVPYAASILGDFRNLTPKGRKVMADNLMELISGEIRLKNFQYQRFSK